MVLIIKFLKTAIYYKLFIIIIRIDKLSCNKTFHRVLCSVPGRKDKLNLPG